MTLPMLPDSCWPVDTNVCGVEWDDYDPHVQARSIALAGSTLRALTGYRVGGCPITVRPCRRGCDFGGARRFDYTGAYFNPVVIGGQWLNMLCGCGGTCGCTVLSQIDLPAPVGQVVGVMRDGAAVDPSLYRLDNGHLLVSLGAPWPLCQDLSLPTTAVGTFSITYLNAYPVDAIGAWAAGILAGEYAKSCVGGKCRLPSGVTSITRQGVSMEITSGAFPDGVTGIREVDTYLMRWNPGHLKFPSAVWSPDMESVRIT